MCTSSSPFTLTRLAGLSIEAESMSESSSEPNTTSDAWDFVRFREPRLRPCSFSTDCSLVSRISSSSASTGVCGAVGGRRFAETDATVSSLGSRLKLSLSFGVGD